MESFKEAIILNKEPLENEAYINEAIKYKVSDDHSKLDIHIRNVQDKTLSEKLKLFHDGFRALAKIVKRHEEIKKIEGTSWIIKKQPGLLKKLGFTIDVDSEEARENIKKYKDVLHYSTVPLEYRNLEPGFAYIYRDEFLKRYY